MSGVSLKLLRNLKLLSRKSRNRINLAVIRLSLLLLEAAELHSDSEPCITLAPRRPCNVIDFDAVDRVDGCECGPFSETSWETFNLELS